MHCVYERLADGRFRCARCGDETSYAPADGRPPLRICARPGLGTRLARRLAALGITKRRYAWLRGRYRVVGGMHCVLVELPPDEPSRCGCGAREAWLNRWGW